MQEVQEPVTPTEIGDVKSEIKSEEITTEVDAQDESVVEDQPKKLSPEEVKLAKLSYKVREERRRNERLMQILEKQLEQQQASKPEKPAPKLEDFATIEDYVRAELAHGKPEPKKAEYSQPRESVDFEDNRDDLLSYGVARHKDFEDVVLGNVQISPIMANSIFELDDKDLQVDTAYYLGKNPKEAARISVLSPTRQIVEITRIASRIEAKREVSKQASTAPEPIKPVVSKQTRSSDPLSSAKTDEEWIRAREKQLRDRRR